MEFYAMESEEENKIIRKVGETIRELRVKQGLSQFKLSIHIGISENQLSRIERGESNPTVRTLCKIAKVFDIDVASLFNNS
jgi:transcriptional regulator with XRE-family HTH domain